MADPIHFDDGDFFMVHDGMERIANVLLNCDIGQIQSLYDLRVIRPGDTWWYVDGSNPNILNFYIVRNEYRAAHPDLVDISRPKLESAIRFLVEHGIDINYCDTTIPVGEITQGHELLSFGTPAEVALYKRDFEMLNFLKSLGANSPRQLPVLAEARAALQNWASIKTAYASGKGANTFSSLPKNILRRIGKTITGMQGGRKTRRRVNKKN